jgi:hypothetical protein
MHVCYFVVVSEQTCVFVNKSDNIAMWKVNFIFKSLKFWISEFMRINQYLPEKKSQYQYLIYIRKIYLIRKNI